MHTAYIERPATFGGNRVPPETSAGRRLRDLGPGGGVNGGEIVAEGTPEQVAAEAKSFTGQYLRETLAKTPVRSAPVLVPKPRKRGKPGEARQPDLITTK